MSLLSLTQSLEARLIARLAAAMRPIGVPVQAFPASPVDFEVAPYRSQIFFSMQSRSFDPPEVIDVIRRDFSQRFTIEWGLQAEFVNLSSHAGVYLVLDRCWLALSGYSPSYTGELDGLKRVVTFEPMHLRSEAFSSLAEGIYTYNQTWSQPVMVYSDISQHMADVFDPGDILAPGEVPDPARPGVEPPIAPPFDLNEIRTGLHRAKVGDLEDEVLDQTLEYPVPES